MGGEPAGEPINGLGTCSDSRAPLCEVWFSDNVDVSRHCESDHGGSRDSSGIIQKFTPCLSYKKYSATTYDNNNNILSKSYIYVCEDFVGPTEESSCDFICMDKAEMIRHIESYHGLTVNDDLKQNDPDDDTLSPAEQGDVNPDSGGSPDVTQASVNNTSYNAIYWAVDEGIVKGYSDGTFRPDDGCQRQHMAIFLYRFNNNLWYLLKLR